MRRFRAKTLKIVEGYYRNPRGFEGFAADKRIFRLVIEMRFERDT